jgi:hypothetical protein
MMSEMIAHTMMVYGEELTIAQIITGELMKQITKIDSDHVQSDIMSLVHENGDY